MIGLRRTPKAKGWQTFSVKVHRVKTFGFVGRGVCCSCSIVLIWGEGSLRQYVSGVCGIVPIKLY